MTDNELAEKVAEKLEFGGIGQHKETKNWIMYTPFPSEGEEYKEEHVFSWPTFGLMIEKADERGWELCIKDQYVFFGIPLEALEDERDYKQETNEYSIVQHGHIRACALAFIEVPNE
jgi:hypothetical protein